MAEAKHVVNYVSILIKHTRHKGQFEDALSAKGFIKQTVDEQCKWIAVVVERDSAADHLLKPLAMYRMYRKDST